MESPTLTTNPPLASVGSASAQIAVAVLSFPEHMTAGFSFTIGNALCAGLRRDSVPVIEHGSFFKSIFSVSVLTVPWALRGEAVESIKAALTELVLLDAATIATQTADDSWLCIHGLGLGGITFDQAFLRPEDIQQCKADLEKFRADSALMWRFAIDQLKARAATRGENPESK
jgi:hypothetical protein